MRDDPIIRSLENTGLPPWGREQPVCPVCGEGCDTIYRNADGDTVGCNRCITAYDAWEEEYEAQSLRHLDTVRNRNRVGYRGGNGVK